MQYPTNTKVALLLATLFGIKAAFAQAPEWQDTAALQKVAEVYVLAETANLPGKVTVNVGSVDSRLHLPHCPAPEAFTPAGTRLTGKSTVGIRCATPNWSLFVPVTIKVMAEVVITARPLARNRPIEATDLATRVSDLSQLPGGVVTDPAQAIGKLAATGIPAGTPLKAGMLRSPLVIQQGQKVRLVAQGQGFKVNAEGKALADGAVGQTITVRTPSGKVVSGVVKSPGLVEIPF